MPKFVVERYELYAQKVEIEAESEAHAIAAVLNGEGTDIDNGLDYIESAEEFGMPTEELSEELEAELRALGVDLGGDYVHALRSVTETE
jgi:hypothetical protein